MQCLVCMYMYVCMYFFFLHMTPLQSTTGSRAFRRAQFGEGTGPVFLEGLECVGTETSLLDCPMDTPLGTSLCDHSDDAGIRCYGTYMYNHYELMRTTLVQGHHTHLQLYLSLSTFFHCWDQTIYENLHMLHIITLV